MITCTSDGCLTTVWAAGAGARPTPSHVEAAIDGGLFCVMYVWGVPLDSVAFICLAMAIGMSVDYVVRASLFASQLPVSFTVLTVLTPSLL